MALNRHKQFRLDAEKKWTEKWFKFVTSKDDCDWCFVSWSCNVTIKFIEAHPEYPWNWHFVSYNPNITMEFIESHPV